MNDNDIIEGLRIAAKGQTKKIYIRNDATGETTTISYDEIFNLVIRQRREIELRERENVILKDHLEDSHEALKKTLERERNLWIENKTVSVKAVNKFAGRLIKSSKSFMDIRYVLISQIQEVFKEILVELNE